MAMTINTNTSSQNAQINLGNSQSSLATSLQRLSSGLRINSAKDDAAGLSISERMTSQIKGLNMAGRNANDAISMTQTTEGNLAQISNVLQRMREISVQSANDSNSTADRQSLQNEATTLSSEIDRIATTAQFNGKNLLDGTVTSSTFQVGANAGQSISVAMTSAKVADLGLSGSAVISGSASKSSAQSAGTSINGTAIGGLVDDGVSSASGSTSTLALANAINAIGGTTGVTAKASTTITSTAISTTTAITAGDFKVNGTSIGALTAAATVSDRNSQMIVAINAVSGTTGVTAAAATNSTYTLTAADGRNITIVGGLNDAGIASATQFGQLTLSSNKDITTVGVVGGITGATYAKSGAAALDINSQVAANSAISQIDLAITNVNNQRAALGTVQTRFESVIANLSTSAQNLSAARGRIRDTDFAAETANLTRNQVLQQAGVAMLAQANAMPNIVLSLLK
jgi:flagellin